MCEENLYTQFYNDSLKYFFFFLNLNNNNGGKKKLPFPQFISIFGCDINFIRFLNSLKQKNCLCLIFEF